MSSSPSLRTVTIGSAVGALGAAIGTAVLGVVLAGTYQPSDAEPCSLPLDAQRDLQLIRWHAWATGAFLVVSVITSVLLPWATKRRRPMWRILTMTSSVLAVVAAVVTGLTRPLVEWTSWPCTR